MDAKRNGTRSGGKVGEKAPAEARCTGPGRRTGSLGLDVQDDLGERGLVFVVLRACVLAVARGLGGDREVVLQAPHQVGGRIGIGQAFLAVDAAFDDQAGEVVLEGLRALGHGFFHGLSHTGEIALLDHLAHELGVEQHFHRGQALASGGTHQALRDDGLQGRRQVAQHGGAHLDRVEAEDPVQRVVAVVAVQGGEAQVARLRVRDGRGHGLAVADFADQDHVGRLAQSVLQRRLQGMGVGADLALVDDRLLVLELVLDRVFHREDVARELCVAAVDHRSERGALARARRPHDQQQATLLEDQFAEDGRQVEAGQLRDVLRDEPHDHRVAAPLAHGAHAEAPHAGERHAHVELARFLQLLDAVRRHDLGQQVLRCIEGQQLAVDGHALAVDLDEDRGVGRKIDVRGPLFGHQPENPLHRAHGVSLAKVVEGAGGRGPAGPGAAAPAVSRAADRSGWWWSGSWHPPS